MLFFLATPEFNKTQSNTTKVKVHLRGGVVEILEQHQNLLGKVENNLLEIETNFENKLEKLLYVLQDAVFIVSNKGLEKNIDSKGTSVYVYARRVKEISSSISIDEISKQFEQKSLELEKEMEKAQVNSGDNSKLLLNSKIIFLKEEVEFLRRTVVIVKGLKS
jgi:hypothetical protein